MLSHVTMKTLENTMYRRCFIAYPRYVHLASSMRSRASPVPNQRLSDLCRELAAHAMHWLSEMHIGMDFGRRFLFFSETVNFAYWPSSNHDSQMACGRVVKR